MSEDEHNYAGWNTDAVKDWVLAFVINLPFPICLLLWAISPNGLKRGNEGYWFGAISAATLILAIGTFFAGRQTRIFIRIIDGFYILAISQLVPMIQAAAMSLSVGLWVIATEQFQFRRDEPFMVAYVVGLTYIQLSVFTAFLLGCVYRKPRWYPQWLRPWNHEFDRIHDTLTRR